MRDILCDDCKEGLLEEITVIDSFHTSNHPEDVGCTFCGEGTDESSVDYSEVALDTWFVIPGVNVTM